MPYIMDINDTKRLLYEQNKNYLGQQTWQKAYENISLAEQQALSDVKYDYAKAINDAYIAANKTEQSIFNTTLGAGYKQRLAEQNRADLMSAFDDYKTNYLQNKASIEAAYDTKQNNITSLLETEAKNVIDYANAHMDYMYYLEQNQPDILNASIFDEYINNVDGIRTIKSKQDLMQVLYDVDGNLTDVGKKFYDLAENYEFDEGYSFTDYLYDNNQDIFNWATSSGYDYNILNNTNSGMFKELTGRNRLDNTVDEWQYNENVNKDTSIKKSDLDYRLKDVSEKWETNLVQLTKDEIINTDYLDDQLETILNNKFRVDMETGWTPDEFLSDIEKITEGQIGVTDWKKGSLVRTIAKDAKEGKIKEGTIVDVNYGWNEFGDADLYIFWKGKFRKLTDKEITHKALSSAR